MNKQTKKEELKKFYIVEEFTKHDARHTDHATIADAISAAIKKLPTNYAIYIYEIDDPSLDLDEAGEKILAEEVEPLARLDKNSKFLVIDDENEAHYFSRIDAARAQQEECTEPTQIDIVNYLTNEIIFEEV